MKKFLFFFSAVMLVLGMVGVASACLITNGDFQTGDLYGWNYHSNVTVSTGPGGNSIAKFNVSGGNGDARLYQNFYVDPSWAGINVDFDFKLSTGDKSSKDFFKSFLRLEIKDTPIDDITTIIKQYDSTSGWQSVSAYIPFTGLSIDPGDPNARLVFLLKEHTGDWSWACLDNVAATAPVPEPATILLLGIGLFGIGGYGRKRSAKMAK